MLYTWTPFPVSRNTALRLISGFSTIQVSYAFSTTENRETSEKWTCILNWQEKNICLQLVIEFEIKATFTCISSALLFYVETITIERKPVKFPHSPILL